MVKKNIPFITILILFGFIFQNELQPKEQKISWKFKYVIKSDHFRLITNVEKGKAKKYSVLLETLYDTFYGLCAQTCDLPHVKEKMKVNLFADQKDFKRYVPGGSASSGFFDARYRAAYLYDFPDMGKTTSPREVFLHECTHLLWWFFSGQTKRRITRRPQFWISEGLACYFETMDDKGKFHPRKSYRFHFAKELVNSEIFAPFKTFAGYTQYSMNPSDLAKSRSRYAQAMSMASFFMEARNVEYQHLFLQCALQVERGYGLKTLFHKKFGKTFKSFENEWQDYVLNLKGEEKKMKEGLKKLSGPIKLPPLNKDGQLIIKSPLNPNAGTFSHLVHGGMDRMVMAPDGEDEEEYLKKFLPPGTLMERSENFIIISDLSKPGMKNLADKCETLLKAYEVQFNKKVHKNTLLRYYNLRRHLTREPLRKNETMRVAYFNSSSKYNSFVRKLFKGAIKGGPGFHNTEHNICVVRKVGGSKISIHSFLAHEMTHLFVSCSNYRIMNGVLPFWISEGCATYNEGLRVKEKKISGVDKINHYRLKFVRPSSLRIERLLRATDQSAFGVIGDNLYGSSWVFYHFLRHGPKEITDRFKLYEYKIFETYFATQKESAKESTRMFKEAFGQDLSRMNEEFKDYARKLKAFKGIALH